MAWLKTRESPIRIIYPDRIHGNGILTYIWLFFYGRCSEKTIHGSAGIWTAIAIKDFKVYDSPAN